MIRTTVVFAITSTILSLHSFAGVENLFKERSELNQTVWKQEIQAQEHEEAFIRLWDSLRPAENAYPILKDFPFKTIRWGEIVDRKTLEHGIHVGKMQGLEKLVTHEQWVAWLTELEKAGIVLEQSEWHHKRFDVNEDGSKESTVSFALHVVGEKSNARYTLDGLLRVYWEEEKGDRGYHEPNKIDVVKLDVQSRVGQSLFTRMGTFDIPPGDRGPALFYDLNKDGHSEIVLPSANKIAWHTGKGFDMQDLGKGPIKGAKAALIGDFDRDGYVDLMIEGYVHLSEIGPSTKGVFLFKGDSSGAISDQPLQVEISSSLFNTPGETTMTSGDIDGDGDLDLLIGQYKEPYLEGHFPTPFYDSKDGYPMYLLINDGSGLAFSDETEARGITDKRYRRVFSASFVDYDDDLDLDLIVVSDFAGVDLYRNDGDGRFEDVTDEAFENRFLFGMAHSIADFNYDGILDFYTIGMSSTTASRLEYMGAAREDFQDRTDKRVPMTYGNRLYYGNGDGTFHQPKASDAVARTGWSWGVVTVDFDNDGDLEFYVANGHDSRETCRDYCPSFWTDDIYRGTSKDNPLLKDYFTQKIEEKADKGISYNGFEHCFLFTPMDDGKIRNISWLGDVAIERDSRLVIAADVNGDGKLDLIVDSNAPNWDAMRDPTELTVYANTFPSSYNWIAVTVDYGPGQPFVEGAKVVVTGGGRKHTASLANGDSFETQHSNTRHFGLGKIEQIDSIEVTWIDGSKKRIENPDINKVHLVSAN